MASPRGTHTGSPGPLDDACEASLVAAARALAEAAPLDVEACARAVELAARVPGWRRQLCAALSATPSDEAAAALLKLPREVPGRIEGIYRAIRRGARRPRPGGHAPSMLAFEFRRSRAADFEQVLAVIADHLSGQLEHLHVDHKARFRFRIDPLFAARGAAGLQSQLEWIQPRLSKRAGTRMWINGWAFDQDGPVSVHSHGPMMSAWLDWARGSAQTRRRIEFA